MYLLCLLANAGCGRIAYDAQPADADADAGGVPVADASPQGALDAPPQTRSLEFGNGATADFSTGTRDTYLYQAEPGTNFGARNLLDADQASHTLLFFDLSAIDPDSTIVSAGLCLTPILNNALTGSGTINLVTQDWAEGVELAAAGVPNWTQRTGTSNWTSAGGDFGAVVANYTSFTDQVRVCIDLDVAAVQEWVSDPTMNFGLGTVSAAYSGGHPHFCSREAVDESCRPALQLEVID